MILVSLVNIPLINVLMILVGYLFFIFKNKEMSLKLIRKSISHPTKNRIVYKNAGVILYNFRYFAEAAEAFMTANLLGDTSVSNYDYLINALEACGNYPEALKIILEKERKHVSGLPYTRNYSIVNKYSVGEFTYGIPIVKDWHQGSTLKIGNFCSIAEDVTIVLGGNHSIDWISSFPFGVIFDSVKDKLYKHPIISKGDVIIGNDVWLAMNVIILSGVTIGDGAVVAAGAIVTKNVAPYTIVGGNPAKSLKKRFDDESITKLLSIKWWDWDISKIERNIDLISSDDIKKFIEKHYDSRDKDNELLNEKQEG